MLIRPQYLGAFTNDKDTKVRIEQSKQVISIADDIAGLDVCISPSSVECVGGETQCVPDGTQK
jgi:hypothetical protein